MKRGRRKQKPRRGSAELPHPKCVYCGIRDGVNMEHVIAASFFKPPLPSHPLMPLPKVPACVECNQLRGDGGQRNLSVDEAYLRDRLCMQHSTYDHPDVPWLLGRKVHPNLLHDRSAREVADIIKSMQFVSVPVGEDQYITNACSFEIDVPRFERVMRKIVKGLYAFHFGKRLPDDHGIVVQPRLDQEMFDRSNHWVDSNNPSQPFVLGKHATVCYRYASKEPNPLGHNWLIVFYRRWGCYAHCGPKSAMAEADLSSLVVS